jgi:hypothetical protein
MFTANDPIQTQASTTNGSQCQTIRAKLLLADYDSTMSDVRRLVRGEGDQLRIGYLASAGQQYLGEPIRACAACTRK